MRKTRVCIYGGTDLQGMPTAFISALAYEILAAMPAVIITGGFRHSNANPEATSTDAAALEGARRFSTERRVSLKECYEAWVPQPTLDTRNDIKGAVRMGEGDGIEVRVMAGRTPLGRRLAMVADVDIVVTISGKVHTEVVVEQALEVGVPVLPIPDAGGDSKNLLELHRSRIAAAFDVQLFDQTLDRVSKTISSDPAKAAKAVLRLLKTAKIDRCLVLLPYDQVHDRLYATIIQPAIEKHMAPVRLDRLPKSDAIYTSFADAVQSCAAVVADITSINESVMYEIGYAHARGLRPLIYTQNPERRERLPVYLRAMNVQLATEATLDSLIASYLLSFRGHREAALSPL